MERGVVVGGLLICGSFLLAVSLNRSAVEELPADDSGAVQAPVSAPIPTVSVDAKPQPEACATDEKRSNESAAPEERRQGDLPGNGPETCSQ